MQKPDLQSPKYGLHSPAIASRLSRPTTGNIRTLTAEGTRSKSSAAAAAADHLNMSANQPTPAVAPAPPQAPPPAPVAVPAPMQPAAAAPQPAAAAQQQPAPSKLAVAPLAPVDAVIDDVFGRQLGMQERQLAADEVAFTFFSSVREACGDEMDPETSAELNRLLALSQAEKGETGHTYSGQ